MKKGSNGTGLTYKFFDSLRLSLKSSAGVILLMALFITLIIHFITGDFYTKYSISAFFRQSTSIIIIGFAQTIVLLTAGIDLSVSSISGLSSMVFAILVAKVGINPFIAMVVCLATGTAMGMINGLFICGLNLTPFIVTLCTSYLFRGITYVSTKGMAVTGITKSVMAIGNGTLFGIIPLATIYMIIIAIILAGVLKFTKFGVRLYALGGNEKAAKIVGIHTKALKMSAYAISGVLCSIAGLLMILRIGSSQLNIGGNWVMPSITAAVIGGTSMNGGSGGVGGTIIGGLFISTISFSISMLGISSYWDDIIIGAVVLAIISIDAFYRMRRFNN